MKSGNWGETSKTGNKKQDKLKIKPGKWTEFFMKTTTKNKDYQASLNQRIMSSKNWETSILDLKGIIIKSPNLKEFSMSNM